jgi:hypothetical protein
MTIHSSPPAFSKLDLMEAFVRDSTPLIVLLEALAW